MVKWFRSERQMLGIDQLFVLLEEILNRQRKIMVDLTALNAAVAANTAAVADVQAVVASLGSSAAQSGVDAAAAQVAVNTAALEALKPVVTPPSS